MSPMVPQAVQSCRELWLILQLDKFPRVRRFTLGERLEDRLLEVLELFVEAALDHLPLTLRLAQGERMVADPIETLAGCSKRPFNKAAVCKGPRHILWGMLRV